MLKRHSSINFNSEVLTVLVKRRTVQLIVLFCIYITYADAKKFVLYKTNQDFLIDNNLNLHT